MKRTTLLLNLLLLFGALQAQSLLWKISGNGLTKPSYLFATHHLAPIAFFDETDSYQEALNSCEQAICEINMKETSTSDLMALMASKTKISEPNVTLNTLLSEEEFETVNCYTKTYLGKDLSTLNTLKPAMISSMIVIQACSKVIADYNPNEQLDTYIQTLAQKENKPVVGLETMEFQFNLLYESQTLERQTQLLLCIVEDIEMLTDMYESLNNAYFEADLEEIRSLSEEIEGTACDATPEELNAINGNRNKEWMKKLPTLMQEKSSFIAVGALHLVGKNGLIKLLKAKGYSVIPVE